MSKSKENIAGLQQSQVIHLLNQQPLLHKHFTRNSPEKQAQFVNKFKLKPSESDEPGFIYGFREIEGYNSSDASYWIKMGRTNRHQPQKRIFQWQKDDHHHYNEMFTVRSEHNKKIQSLLHLLFAYARKERYINGNRRIQWFYFEEKVPTAAITNLLNEIMEETHQRYLFGTYVGKQKQNDEIVAIDHLDKEETPVFTQYSQLCHQLKQRYQSIKEGKFSVMVVGLPQTGKTIFSNLLMGNQVVVDDQDGQFKVSNSIQKIFSQIIQISDPNLENRPVKMMLNQLLIRRRMSLCLSIIPVLTIKQSDIESSKLAGFRQGLELLSNYVQVEKIVLVITHASKRFTAAKARYIIRKNKQWLKYEQLEMLRNSQFVIIKNFERPGSLSIETQNGKPQPTFETWSSTCNQLWANMSFELSQNLQSQYQKLNQSSFLDIMPLLSKRLSGKLAKLPDTKQKVVMLMAVQQIVNNLSDPKLKNHQTVSIFLKLLSNWFQLTHQEEMKLFIWEMSFLTSSKPQRDPLLLTLKTQLKDELSTIKQQYQTRVAKQLSIVKEVILKLQSKGNCDIIEELTNKMIDDLPTMIDLLVATAEKGKKSMDEDSRDLVKAIEKLVEVLQQVSQIIKLGLELNNVLKNIKQNIIPQQKKTTKSSKIIKTSEQNQKSKTLPTDHPLQGTLSQNIQTLVKNSKQVSIKTISQLIHRIKNSCQKGSSVLNIVDHFIIDDYPKTHKIQYNFFILAKTIQVKGKCDLSFQGVQNNPFGKLQFITIAQQYKNIDQLNPKYKSRNGQPKLMIYNKEQNATKGNSLHEALWELYETKIKQLPSNV